MKRLWAKWPLDVVIGHSARANCRLEVFLLLRGTARPRRPCGGDGPSAHICKVALTGDRGLNYSINQCPAAAIGGKLEPSILPLTLLATGCGCSPLPRVCGPPAGRTYRGGRADGSPWVPCRSGPPRRAAPGTPAPEGHAAFPAGRGASWRGLARVPGGTACGRANPCGCRDRPSVCGRRAPSVRFLILTPASASELRGGSFPTAAARGQRVGPGEEAPLPGHPDPERPASEGWSAGRGRRGSLRPQFHATDRPGASPARVSEHGGEQRKK